MISAEVIADSLSFPLKSELSQSFRATSFVLTYPRFIHSEIMTHREFSRNAASSRAIPGSVMRRNVRKDPFIPVAFQEKHKGMQGTKYLSGWRESMAEFIWKMASKTNVAFAKALDMTGVTKQISNRILEPFQWYTTIVTSTEYDNFFELRSPEWNLSIIVGKNEEKAYGFRTRLGAEHWLDMTANNVRPETLKDWLLINKSHAEIHISLLAEAMEEAMHKSTPKRLGPNEWHIPFGDKIDTDKLLKVIGKYGAPYQECVDAMIKIATARCARVSYLNFEGKDDYKADIKLYDRLLADGHMSPFEHCLRAMDSDEFLASSTKMRNNTPIFGWSGNVRGFVQLRKTLENEYRTR